MFSFLVNGSVSWQCTWIANVVFWFFSLLGLTADYLVETRRAPRFLIHAKIQSDRHYTWREKMDLILLTAFNMLFVSTCICCPLYESLWHQMYPSLPGKSSNPRLTIDDEWSWSTELFLKMPIHVVVTETCFYTLHRLLHALPWLYRHVHKVHHRWTAPTAMACVYAHPLEFALANVWPIYASAIVTNAHPYTCYAWWALAMAGTCLGHCGYRIAGYQDAHDQHHVSFHVHYGGLFLSDWLMGTTATCAKATTTSSTSTRHYKQSTTNCDAD